MRYNTITNWSAYEENRERLTAAFRALRKQSIVAKQNFLCCGGCASCDIWNDEDERRKAGKPHRDGAVYYHRQAAQRRDESGQFYMGHGAFDGSDDADIARRVMEVLREYDVPAFWNGDTGTCIFVDLNFDLTDDADRLAFAVTNAEETSRNIRAGLWDDMNKKLIKIRTEQITRQAAGVTRSLTGFAPMAGVIAMYETDLDPLLSKGHDGTVKGIKRWAKKVDAVVGKAIAGAKATLEALQKEEVTS